MKAKTVCLLVNCLLSFLWRKPSGYKKLTILKHSLHCTVDCAGQCHRADGMNGTLPLALLEMDLIKSPVVCGNYLLWFTCACLCLYLRPFFPNCNVLRMLYLLCGLLKIWFCQWMWLCSVGLVARVFFLFWCHTHMNYTMKAFSLTDTHLWNIWFIQIGSCAPSIIHK